MTLDRPSPPGAAALLALAHLLLTIDFTIVYVALPSIGEAFGLPAHALQWVVHGYTVLFGGFLLLGGRAADRLGARRVLALALAAFGAASVLGGLAQQPWQLVAARAGQGLAAALIFPATLALIGALFPDEGRRTRALTLWSLAGPTGLALGSILGGLLTSAFGWRAVFHANAPLAAVLALLALAVIPRTAGQGGRGRLDLGAAVAGTAGVSLVIYALVRAPDAGWDLASLFIGAAGLLLASVFVGLQRRAADPLLPLGLLRNGDLAFGMAVIALFMAAFMTLSFLQTVMFQGVLGYDPWTTGLAFLAPCLAQAAGAQVGGRLVRRLPPWPVIGLGLAVGAIGAAALGFAPRSGGYLALLPALAAGYFGQGIAFGPIWWAMTRRVAPDRQGVASAAASTAFQLGGAAGMAALLAALAAGGQEVTQPAVLRSAFLLAALPLVLGAVLSLVRAARDLGGRPEPQAPPSPAAADR